MPDSDTPLLSVKNITVSFPMPHARTMRAVDDVTFHILPGESVGLVGESGSGKTTVGRTIVGLTQPDSGFITFDGLDITATNSAARRSVRNKIQMVFQDPSGSLNPRMTIGDCIVEPLHLAGSCKRSDRRRRAGQLLERVGLQPAYATRFPHELSGGQRQRVGIARALAATPRLIVLDEPVSALDVSIQAQILNLLADLRKELALTYLFIAHNLAVVRNFCERIAVLQHGRIVELAETDELFARPRQPYTQALLAAVPQILVHATA